MMLFNQECGFSHPLLHCFARGNLLLGESDLLRPHLLVELHQEMPLLLFREPQQVVLTDSRSLSYILLAVLTYS